ncbi:MAG: tetratricopeptide repeat protein [Pseudomonadota bacterium]
MTRLKSCPPHVTALLLLGCLHGFAQPAPSAGDTAASATLSTAQPAESLPEAETSSSRASYEQLIADLQITQNSSGATTALSEAYTGLGNSLQTLGRHEDAVVAYEQALQLLRQSKGLYELEQLPVLQARLVSNQALAAWQDVDTGRYLAYQIALRNPGAGIALHYQTLRELGLWKLRAAEDDLLQNSLDGVQEAAALYRLELERPGIRAAYQNNALFLANLYLDLAALEFLQARKKLELPLSAYVEGGQRTVTEMYCETIPMPGGRERQVCRSMQVPNMDYFMSLSNKKYSTTWEHLNAMQDAVLEAYAVLLPEVATEHRDDALTLLSEVHNLTDAFNDFVAQNARRTGSRIAGPTGSRINR